MIYVQKICLLLLSLSQPLAASESDTVNERVPVSKAELEAHWDVDCAQVADSMAQVVMGPTSGDVCEFSPGLRHQLQLCAFIYQAPGADSSHLCPDYRGSLEALERSGPDGDCVSFKISLHSLEDCATR